MCFSTNSGATNILDDSVHPNRFSSCRTTQLCFHASSSRSTTSRPARAADASPCSSRARQRRSTRDAHFAAGEETEPPTEPLAGVAAAEPSRAVSCAVSCADAASVRTPPSRSPESGGLGF